KPRSAIDGSVELGPNRERGRAVAGGTHAARWSAVTESPRAGTMKTRSTRLFAALALAPLTGCVGAPCQTSNECAASEVCASAHCQSLARSEICAAIEPQPQVCRPLPVDSPSEVRGWVTCENPCRRMPEFGCIGDKH